VKHKYRAQPTTFKGRKYASKLEAKYAAKLELAKKAGDLLFYLDQVPIRLPGSTTYRLDFLEFWAPKEGEEAGDVIFTEVKGLDLALGKMKRSQAEEMLGLKINVVRK